MGDGIDQVMALARSGNRPGARQLVLELLRENPDDVVALLWLAYTSDSVEEVDVVLNRVLLLDPGNSKALEWQALVRQKQQRLRAGQTGPLAPLPPTPPAPLTTNHRPSAYTPPALNPGSASYNAPLYAQPQPGSGYSDIMASQPNPAYVPQPYQPTSQPLTPWTPQAGQYQVTVAPGPQSIPMLPYVQPAPISPPAARPKWPFILGAVVLCLILGAALFFVTSGRAKPGLADYRLFTSLDSLVNEGFVDERIAIEARFMGGYTKDSTGTYLLTYPDGKNILYIQWHESATAINDFRPGQFITIYGRLIGVGGNRATVKADKVTLSN